MPATGEVHFPAPVPFRYSEPDIDGLVLVMRPPGFKWVDPQALDLSKLRNNTINLSSLPNAAYNNMLQVPIGYVGGMPFGILTTLTLAQVRTLFELFLVSAELGSSGYQNNWIVGPGHTADQLRQIMRTTNNHKIRLDNEFWDSFSANVERLVLNTFGEGHQLFISVMWFGMKMPSSIFFNILRDRLFEGNVIDSSIHVGVEVSAGAEEERKLLVLLDGSLKHRCTGRATWFVPLGLKYAATCRLMEGNRLLSTLQTPALPRIFLLRIYVPELSYCNPHNATRGERGSITAGAIIGKAALAGGPYQGLLNDVSLRVRHIDQGLKQIHKFGCKTRFEFVLGDSIGMTEETCFTIRDALMAWRPNGESPVMSYDYSVIPMVPCVAPAIQVISGLGNRFIPRVMAAEAYLQFLVDGGTRRLNYAALKMAFGTRTIGEVVAQTWGDMMESNTNDFDHVSWLTLNGVNSETILKDVAYHLGVPREAVSVVFKTLKRIPDGDNGQSDQAGHAWLSCVMELERLRLGTPEPLLFTQEYHRRRRTCLGQVTFQTLATVLLLQRADRSIRSLEVALLDRYLSNRLPATASLEDKTNLLAYLVETKAQGVLRAWPHSRPVASRDRTDAWWLVGPSEASLIVRTLEEIIQRIPSSVGKFTTAANQAIDFVSSQTWWDDILALRRSRVGRDARMAQVSEFEFLAIWLMVLTAAEHRRRGWMEVPFLRWGEWRRQFPHINHLLEEMRSLGVVDSSVGTNTPSPRTIFNDWVVPPNFGARMEAFRETLVGRGVLRPPAPPVVVPPPPPQLPVPVPVVDDGVLQPIQDLPPAPSPQVRRTRTNADQLVIQGAAPTAGPSRRPRF